jgi:tetratricopeptide (TPR) repeat protein
LQVAAFLAAASATAAAALLGATAVAALLWSRRRRTLLVGLAALALVLAAVSVQRDGILLDPANPRGPWQERAGNFRAAWSMAADHPWIGVGPGGFSELYPSYRQSGDNETRHVHNLPLELGAEVGWPAAVLLTALFFFLFCRPLWIERRPGPAWRKGLAIGLTAFALHNLGDFSAFMPSLLWISAILLGLWTSREEAGTPMPVRGLERATAGAALAAVLLAALGAGLSGLAADRRMSARFVSYAGDRVEALRLASQAVRLAPWDPDAALLHARTTEAALPDRGLALERADKAVALSPVRPAARVLRGRLRLAVGDLEGGYSDLTEAVRLYPLEANYARQRDILRAEMERWMTPGTQAGSR